MKPAYTPLGSNVLPLPVTMLTRQSMEQYMLPFRGTNPNPSHNYRATGPLHGPATGRGIDALVGGAPTTYLSGPGSSYPLAPRVEEALAMSMRLNPRPELLPATAAAYDASHVLPITSMVHGPPGPYNPIVDGRQAYRSQGPTELALRAATRNKAIGPYSIGHMMELKNIGPYSIDHMMGLKK